MQPETARLNGSCGASPLADGFWFVMLKSVHASVKIQSVLYLTPSLRAKGYFTE